MEIVYKCRRECCPEMFYDEKGNIIIIKDDKGGSVSLTLKEYETLYNAYQNHFSKDLNNDGN